MSRLSVFIQAPAPPLFKKNIFDANFVSGQNGMAWKSITSDCCIRFNDEFMEFLCFSISSWNLWDQMNELPVQQLV